MEPISLLFDTFIKLMDRIISQKNLKEKNKQQLFKEIIEPLFIELQPVVDNYFLLFRRAKQSIRESKGRVSRKSIREVREAREAMLVVRIKVRETANRISNEIADEEIANFASKVEKFFYHKINRLRGSLSDGEILVGYLEEMLEEEITSYELVSFIDEILEKMEKSWISIVQSYARLRIYYLSTPDSVKKKKKKVIKAKQDPSLRSG